METIMENINRMQTGGRAGLRWHRVILVLTMAILAMLVKSTSGQNVVKNARDLSANEKSAVIQALCRSLKSNYVFPDIADQIVARLKEKEKAGRYLEVSEGEVFAKLLTDDIRTINGDRHLKVRPTPKKTETDETDLGTELSRKSGKYSNCGFEEVKIK